MKQPEVRVKRKEMKYERYKHHKKIRTGAGI